jgi:hypothetical protein
MNKTLLLQAKNKRKTRNILNEKDFSLSMEDFILKIYTVCTPNLYGDSFPKKIQLDLFDVVKSVSSSLDRGDLHVNYKKFIECKISFLNANNSYSIANIRDWQLLDYFILCFVDHNFKSSFYCVDKKVITENPRVLLTGMNNSGTINSFNKYVGKRTSIRKDEVDYILKQNNLLNGTSYRNLISFLKTLNK